MPNIYWLYTGLQYKNYIRIYEVFMRYSHQLSAYYIYGHYPFGNACQCYGYPYIGWQ